MDEFELTFLPKQELLPKLAGCEFQEMLDVYVPVTAHHVALRLRRKGEKYEITKKHPAESGDASHMLEHTIPLTKDEFEYLAQVPGMRIEKRRYAYEENGQAYEVDVFQGDLAGLVLVDAEFAGLEEKSKFVAPDWVLADVTQEEFVAGGMICGKKYADIEKELEKFGYEKLSV